MENVPEVIGTNNIKHFAKWLEKLESLGYKCYWQVLNAKDYGVPQNRERCFMVSILGDYYYHFKEPIPLEYKLKDILEKDVDESYYLSDKMISGMIETNFETYKLKNKLKGIDNIADTIIARFDGCPQCVLIKNKKYATEKDVKNYIEQKEQGFLDQENYYIVRKYTPRECFRLMGVEDKDFDKIAQNQSNASLYHLAGDSIVVDVLMAIFKNML